MFYIRNHASSFILHDIGRYSHFNAQKQGTFKQSIRRGTFAMLSTTELLGGHVPVHSPVAGFIANGNKRLNRKWIAAEDCLPPVSAKGKGPYT